ncbi:unnamed protein product [Leuciscus chuanchicus]
MSYSGSQKSPHARPEKSSTSPISFHASVWLSHLHSIRRRAVSLHLGHVFGRKAAISRSRYVSGSTIFIACLPFTQSVGKPDSSHQRPANQTLPNLSMNELQISAKHPGKSHVWATLRKTIPTSAIPYHHENPCIYETSWMNYNPKLVLKC